MTKVHKFTFTKDAQLMGTRFKSGDIMLTVDGKKAHVIFTDETSLDYDLGNYPISAVSRIMECCHESVFYL